MADEEAGSGDELRKEIESLKAKVVELENKLSRHHVTDEEWKTYRKVVSVMLGQAGLPESSRDDKSVDSEGTDKGRVPGPRHFYVLVPISSASSLPAVGPAVFVRGFKDLGS
jgi:hypothetical protein